jgi:hypothetical protein
MANDRFDHLHEALLRAGVAPRHARRALTELEEHFRQLVDDGRSRGESVEQAESAAHRLLGADQSIIERFAAQPELRAWACRRPGLVFAAMPPLLFVAIIAATIVAVSAGADWAGGYLPDVQVAPELSRVAGVTARVLVLWCVPVLVSAFFARLAYRQRMALRWPCLAVALVSTLAGLGDFELVIAGPRLAGTIRAGLGWGLDTLLAQSVRALITSLVVLIPLVAAARAAARTQRGEGR